MSCGMRVQEQRGDRFGAGSGERRLNSYASLGLPAEADVFQGRYNL